MIQKDYSTLLQIFENHLSTHQLNGSPNSLYEPIRYINNIGGKRIRPVLVLMAYNLWFDDVSPALPAALAMEYFHNFTLMHDDIMDESEMRRGKPSVHKQYGMNAAILSGDAMLIKAFDYLIDLELTYRLGSSVSLLLAKTSLQICEGQQMDMDFETSASPTEPEYLEMIRKKTACLIGASLRIGSMLAGVPAEVGDKLYSCGENLGLAFQIQDDILDVFGDSRLTGKKTGGDILRGKKNFLYVRVYNSLSEKEKTSFIEDYARASTESNIDDVLETYKSMKIEDYAQGMQQYYFEQAMKCISNLPSVDTSILKNFALQLMSRDH
jgi:geranylgeranyl diphosphate synthase, type II